MKMIRNILVTILFCLPVVAFGDISVSAIEKANTYEQLFDAMDDAILELESKYVDYKSITSKDLRNTIDPLKSQLLEDQIEYETPTSKNDEEAEEDEELEDDSEASEEEEKTADSAEEDEEGEAEEAEDDSETSEEEENPEDSLEEEKAEDGEEDEEEEEAEEEGSEPISEEKAGEEEEEKPEWTEDQLQAVLETARTADPEKDGADKAQEEKSEENERKDEDSITDKVSDLTNNAKEAKEKIKDAKDKLADTKSTLEQAKDKLDSAKNKEQSLGNRLLGGLTTAATGIGAMQLAQGISENMADKAASKDMKAYIETMRCEYGNDNNRKTVKFGDEAIFLPTDATFAGLRQRYLELAADLKVRKEALGLNPGIESAEIVDASSLYDDENTGITSGAYASRYRAASGVEKDEKGIKSQEKEAKTRMIAGGVVAGAGLVAGIVGNALLNKENKDGATENDSFRDVQVENIAQAKRLIEMEYPKVKTETCVEKTNTVISGRTQDTLTCDDGNGGKIRFEFDDLSEPKRETSINSLTEYFGKNYSKTEISNKINEIIYK